LRVVPGLDLSFQVGKIRSVSILRFYLIFPPHIPFSERSRRVKCRVLLHSFPPTRAANCVARHPLHARTMFSFSQNFLLSASMRTMCSGRSPPSLSLCFSSLLVCYRQSSCTVFGLPFPPPPCSSFVIGSDKVASVRAIFLRPRFSFLQKSNLNFVVDFLALSRLRSPLDSSLAYSTPFSWRFTTQSVAHILRWALHDLSFWQFPPPRI